MTAPPLRATDERAPSKPRVRKATVAAPNLAPNKAYRAGELIGQKYRLIELLGQGGMGAVWRAHNETLDVDVAIKLIRAKPDAPDHGDRATQRLLHEARAAAQIGHPAIARVFDFGISDQREPYIVMELLSGSDLADVLSKRGRLSPMKAVRTMIPIADALDAAHCRGIVHRDLKPENIVLSRAQDGRLRPKLVDFGIAKSERAASLGITHAGAALGSPMYMSPEQVQGLDVDSRSDVWAFSVVLYELITGKPPFEGKNYNALVQSIVSSDPPQLMSFGVGDDDLWRILRRGLHKDVNLRWSSIADLGIALAAWLSSRGVYEDISGGAITTRWLRRRGAADVVASIAPGATLSVSTPAEPASLATSKRTSLSRPRMFLIAGISALVGLGLVAATASDVTDRGSGPISGVAEPRGPRALRVQATAAETSSQPATRAAATQAVEATAVP